LTARAPRECNDLRESEHLGLLSRVCLLLSVAALCACAVGNKHRYADVVADLPYTGSGKVAVATVDQRPYVLSGNKKPHFVGLSRGGYGNTFSITTVSGRPLADDMTSAVERSLAARGFQGVPVFVSPGETDAAVAEKIRATNAERAVVLTLREWKSDTYQNTALHYDLTLRVLDASGALRAETALSGKDDLGGSFWNPPSHAKSAGPPAFKSKLEQMLADPQVAAALR
jgi:hypothetical protein